MGYYSPPNPLLSVCNQARGAFANAVSGVLDRWSALRICFASNLTEGQDVGTNAPARQCLREASCQPERDVQAQPQESVREKKKPISDKRTCYPSDPLGPDPALHCACGGYCWKKESILCISGATADLLGRRCGPWWLCCSSRVIWSVSGGILIESEAFQINPETSRLPARATSESKGHSMVTFSQRTLERAELHMVAGSPGPADREPDPDWTPGHIWMQFPFYSFFKHFNLGKEGEVNKA